jgi:hypothetical protein
VSAFDPWTATLEDAERELDAWASPGGAVYRCARAQYIAARRDWYEDHPVDGVATCVRNDLVAPDWLARAFLRLYDKVLNCHVRTWDEAFGPAHYAKGHLSTLRHRRTYGRALQMMFSGPNRWTGEKLPRTDAGCKEAARVLGLTPKQVKTLLHKTRTNTRGHKAYGKLPATQAVLTHAHDPFRLAGRGPKSR